MSKVRTFIGMLDDASFHVKLNTVMIVVWGILAIPTMLWWKEAIPWLVFMSWYANWVGHISALLAAKAEKKIDETNEDTSDLSKLQGTDREPAN